MARLLKPLQALFAGPQINPRFERLRRQTPTFIGAARRLPALFGAATARLFKVTDERGGALFDGLILEAVDLFRRHIRHGKRLSVALVALLEFEDGGAQAGVFLFRFPEVIIQFREFIRCARFELGERLGVRREVVFLLPLHNRHIFSFHFAISQ